MTIKRIHINQHIIRANRKNGTNDPPITVKEGKQNYRAHEVYLTGPSLVKYSPHKPMKCGATVWIETKGTVVVNLFPNIP